MATAAAPRVYRNFINGEWVESESGKAYENRNPANTDELVGMFVSSTSEDVDAAVESAKQAYKKWRLVPAPKRAEILYRAAESMVRAQRRLFEGHDARNGQGARRDARRRAGSDRHDVLHGGRRPPPVRSDDAVGVAEQICDERAPVDRRGGIDHAVEFSDGDSVVEDDAGAGLRKHGRVEAGGRHAAFFVSLGADS